MEPEKPEIDLERLNISPALKAAIRQGIEDGLFVLPEPFRIHIDPLCDRAYLERAEEGLMIERPPASLKAVAKVAFINARVIKPARPERLPSIPIELARCMGCDELTDDCTCDPPENADCSNQGLHTGHYWTINHQKYFYCKGTE